MYSHNLYSIVAVYFCTWAGKWAGGIIKSCFTAPDRKSVV